MLSAGATFGEIFEGMNILREQQIERGLLLKMTSVQKTCVATTFESPPVHQSSVPSHDEWWPNINKREEQKLQLNKIPNVDLCTGR